MLDTISKGILQRYLFNLYFLVDNYSVMMKIFLSTIKIQRFIYGLATSKCMSGDKFANEDAEIDTLVDTAMNENHFSLCAVEALSYNQIHSVDHRCYLKLKVNNTQGLHMRPSATIVDITNKYEGEIYAKEFRKGRVVNGKSIFDFLTLAATQGTDIVFCFKYEGKNSAKKAANCAYELAELFKNNFNE